MFIHKLIMVLQVTVEESRYQMLSAWSLIYTNRLRRSLRRGSTYGAIPRALRRPLIGKLERHLSFATLTGVFGRATDWFDWSCSVRRPGRRHIIKFLFQI